MPVASGNSSDSACTHASNQTEQHHHKDTPPTSGATGIVSSPRVATFDKRRFHDLIKERQMLRLSHPPQSPSQLSVPVLKPLDSTFIYPPSSASENAPSMKESKNENIKSGNNDNDHDDDDGKQSPVQARQALINLAARYKSPSNIINIKRPACKHNYDAENSLTLTTEGDEMKMLSSFKRFPLEQQHDDVTHDATCSIANEKNAYHHLAKLLSDNEEEDGIHIRVLAGGIKEDQELDNCENKKKNGIQNYGSKRLKLDVDGDDVDAHVEEMSDKRKDLTTTTIETRTNTRTSLFTKEVGRNGRFDMILQMMGEYPSQRIVKRTEASGSVSDPLISDQNISSGTSTGSDANYLVQLTSMIDQESEEKSSIETTSVSSPHFLYAYHQKDGKANMLEGKCSEAEVRRAYAYECTADSNQIVNCLVGLKDITPRIPLDDVERRERWMRYGDFFFCLMLAFFTSFIYFHLKKIHGISITEPLFKWGARNLSSHDGNNPYTDHRRHLSPKDHFNLKSLLHRNSQHDDLHCYSNGRHRSRSTNHNDCPHQNSKQENNRDHNGDRWGQQRDQDHHHQQQQQNNQHHRRRLKDINIVQKSKPFFISMAQRVNKIKGHIPTIPKKASNIILNNRTRTSGDDIFKTCTGGIVRISNFIITAARDSVRRQRIVQKIQPHIHVNLKDLTGHIRRVRTAMKPSLKGLWEDEQERIVVVSEFQQGWKHFSSTLHDMEEAFTERMRENIKELMEDGGKDDRSNDT
eukprot:CAMPEP_0204618182 /NCGR_PEP_ID=MMETSP0717-20131115/4910_1 /ASSEMBLY_ACC=CAM_ASM_000666 /TAXON_ID=230516 /ORGANISM="Chaetoceros curvisetus" /LENGTH=749 /DNA_ID=CAMNT_0051631871 /DNA_START=81 /DNA_END=2330 /DNA_ORIENTATION=-